MNKAISGKVIHGKSRGKELGFPTVNIELPDKIQSGVYAGIVTIDGEEYVAGIFAGLDGKKLEAHLPDFSGDLYGKEIGVRIGKKIRDVRKFGNDKELTEQIKKDINIVCLLGQ